ncbi:MAG: acylphosphatase [Candidatus Aenigmarchaeota archaeon]|nr:acylphosphatase [Candidatus Aenigmarchaeota archaeon]
MKAAHIFVSGRVQGVFYRSFVKHEATKLGLRGFVRNLRDGRIEVWVEGLDDRMFEMTKKIKAGPEDATVSSVEILWKHPKRMKGFEIIR